MCKTRRGVKMAPRMTHLLTVLAIAACGIPARGYVVQVPEISLLSPQGIRFAYPDEPGVTLVAYHYSINKPVHGVNAGDWNFDVNSATDGYWISDNTAVVVVPGDVVNYWVNVIATGGGYNLVEQSWTATEPVPSTPPPPIPPTTTTVAPTQPPPAPSTPAPIPVETDPPGPQPTSGPSPPSGCTMYPCEATCDMNTAPCNGLIFEDNFDTLNLDFWEHEITAGGGGNWEFEYYTNNRSNSYVRDGTLYLKPTLTTETFGDGFLESGTLNLWGASPANLCTGNAWWGCERAGNPTNIINPIQSARIRSTGSFSFKYGRVEVEARMPTGDWIWPAIWLLPKHSEYGEWPASGEIDLVECRGNANLQYQSGTSAGIDQMGSTMHWGPFYPMNGYPKTHATKNLSGGQTFGNSFHKYVLDWTSNDLKFYVDDELILTADPAAQGAANFWDLGNFASDAPGIDNPWAYTSDKIAPFNKEYYLIFNVAVGGTNYFGDDLINSPYPKPWLNSSPTAALDFWNARNDWLPTWNGEDAAMQVNYVRVTANSETTYHINV